MSVENTQPLSASENSILKTQELNWREVHLRVDKAVDDAVQSLAFVSEIMARHSSHRWEARLPQATLAGNEELAPAARPSHKPHG